MHAFSLLGEGGCDFFGLFLKIMEGGGKSYLSSFLSKFLCLSNASNIRALMAQSSEERAFHL
jgi:hypothetical protein